ncbi:hypothetical protein bthur0006_2750 [Bacillus thuringiensis serovar kurstaki str. T03a001]|nr:hypothetical protein bthur0006_2750 [Bacillus thuringiensis serovar kurstaki str. T03a001]
MLDQVHHGLRTSLVALHPKRTSPSVIRIRAFIVPIFCFIRKTLLFMKVEIDNTISLISIPFDFWDM